VALRARELSIDVFCQNKSNGSVFEEIRLVLSQDDLASLSRALAAAPGAGGVDEGRARERRRAEGAYFTPAPLVEAVVREALGARLARAEPAWRRDGSPELTVLDPAAGDGRFLLAAADALAERAAARGYGGAGPRAAIVRRCLVGVERDPEFAALARARLGDGAVVHCAEALLSPVGQAARADVVVGNPPYVRSIRLGESDEALRSALRGRYAATSHGEWDLYAAFIEQALAWARPDGEVALVVPSRWLTARCAELLRAKLASARAVRGLVLFGAEQIFPGATTYASVAFLSRAPQPSVFVARREGADWSHGQVPAGELGGAPWRLSVGGRRTVVERLAASGPALGAVARVAKGAGTNADPVFVLEAGADVEAALVRRCLRGRDVVAYGAASRAVRVLVPYRRDGSFIEPHELAHRWPRAAAHLARHRAVLERRERGRFRGDAFYRWGRPQNMAYLGAREPKIVVPDVAKAGRALCDRGAAMVLDSAYAIRPLDGAVSPGLLLAVMNSGVVALWLGETGTPLRGGYVRLKTAYLESLPLPPASSPHARAAAELALAPDAASRAAEIDDLVRRAYGLASWD
jgi:methylase of polypeptide subunit release factors